MTVQRFAHFLSIVLGPIFWYPLLLVILITNVGLSAGQVKIFLPLLFLTQFIIPVAYNFTVVKNNMATAWDLPQKRERLIFYGVWIACFIVSMVFIGLWGNETLLRLTTILLVLMIVNAIITKWWKISFHVGAMTILAIMINYLLDWRYPIIYLLIPIIAWARLVQKKHTPAQVMVAFLLNTLIILLGLKIFHYL